MEIKRLISKDVQIVHRFGTSESAFNLTTEAQAFWTEQQLTDWFASEDGVCLGAWQGDKLVGFALATMHSATGKALFENLFVVPKERRTGVGLELIKQLIKELRIKGASYVASMIHIDNTASYELHNKLGFKSCGQFYWIGIGLT